MPEHSPRPAPGGPRLRFVSRCAQLLPWVLAAGGKLSAAPVGGDASANPRAFEGDPPREHAGTPARASWRCCVKTPPREHAGTPRSCGGQTWVAVASVRCRTASVAHPGCVAERPRMRGRESALLALPRSAVAIVQNLARLALPHTQRVSTSAACTRVGDRIRIAAMVRARSFAPFAPFTRSATPSRMSVSNQRCERASRMGVEMPTS